MFATVRMKRFLLALLPWMVLTAAAWGQTRPAELFFSHLGVLSERGLRVGDECFMPVEALRRLGWETTIADGIASVKVHDRAAQVPLRTFGDQPMVPFRRLSELLGFDATWRGSTNTLELLARLESVRYREGKIEVDATLPVRLSVATQTNPDRIVVDLEGARIVPETKLALEGNTRIVQLRDTVVRVTIEGRPAPALPVLDPARTLAMDLFASDPAGNPTGPVPTIPNVEPGSEMPPLNPATPARPTLPPVTAGPLVLRNEGPNAATFQISLSRALASPPRFRRPEPDTIEILLPQAILNLGAELPVSASVQSIESRMEGTTAILALKLSRPMGAEISPDGRNLIVRLIKPSVGNGRLAGKIVVIDPGHGGKDGGARAPDGSALEKTLNLNIGRYAAEYLAQEGATVIMTRKTDVFVSLRERAEIANRNNAHFFISIHINSSGLNSKARGGMTFYHKRDPIGQLLADCIQGEIKKISGIPCLGSWSDQRIYGSGFAVLRYARMPAVLIECGFINNVHDRRRMVTRDFQQGVAMSIVRGLRVYLGDDKAKE